MRLRYVDAFVFERVLEEGRTKPVVLGCRGEDEPAPIPVVVKALGCPEVHSRWQLVAEVVGNAVARRMGVETPEPFIVSIDAPVAAVVNRSLAALGYNHSLSPGHAAGCRLLAPTPVPYAPGQTLSPDQVRAAQDLYVFDLLSQNVDRRVDNVNCALTKHGIVAFDFELCFAHLFLKLIGQSAAQSWRPSDTMPFRKHVFYALVRSAPPAPPAVEAVLDLLDEEWWMGLVASLPETWQGEASRIGTEIARIIEHKSDFAEDVMRSLA